LVHHHTQVFQLHIYYGDFFESLEQVLTRSWSWLHDFSGPGVTKGFKPRFFFFFFFPLVPTPLSPPSKLLPPHIFSSGPRPSPTPGPPLGHSAGLFHGGYFPPGLVLRMSRSWKPPGSLGVPVFSLPSPFRFFFPSRPPP